MNDAAESELGRADDVRSGGFRRVDLEMGQLVAGTRADSRGNRRSRAERAVGGMVENHLLVALIFLLATVLLVIGPELFVADSWLTLVSGREISQHGLPHREALTAIPFGRVWTDQQWLAQLIFYWLDRAGGLRLTVVLHALVVTAAFAVTVVASRVRGASAQMTLVAAVVSLFVAPWSWQLRAQSIALPLFAVTLALMATDSRLAARRSYLVFPALILWANIHGSVILGAALVSLAAAVAGVARARSSEVLTPVWKALVFLLLPWACVMASPYGTALVRYYRLLLFDSPVSRNVQEWRPPQPHGYLLVFFAVAAATVVVAVWQRRRLSAYDLLVLAVTLAGALRSGRGIVWFSLAAAMLLPVALDGFVRPGRPAHVRRRLAYWLGGGFVALLVLSLGQALARSDRWYEQGWPARAARATAQESLASGGTVVWPSDKYADWLLWKEPSLRGHMAWDVRFELLTAGEIRSIVEFKHRRPGWARQVQAYPVLALNQAETKAQTRVLRRADGTTVAFANDDLVVLVRPQR